MEIKIEDMVRLRNFQDIEFYAIPAKLIDRIKKKEALDFQIAEDNNKLAMKIAADAAEAIKLAKIKEEEAKTLKLAEKKRIAKEKAKLAVEVKAKKEAEELIANEKAEEEAKIKAEKLAKEKEAKIAKLKEDLKELEV